jgi:glycine/D-amino acid oxidase-like deaminating enzyme
MSSSNDSYRITIIGAGIIGLTTACTLLKEYAANENLQLTIISETFSPNTTGDVSAGYWEPHGLEKIDEKILRWAGYTYSIFLNEFFSTKAARAGIMKISSYILKGFDGQNKTNNQINIKPQYSELVQHFRSLDKHEISMFDHLKPTSGFAMSSIVVEISKYLPELYRFLAQDYRVRFIKKKIHSIIELKDKADVVINCTGLASRYLVGDQTIRPARGQVYLIKIIFFLNHCFYLFRLFVFMPHG